MDNQQPVGAPIYQESQSKNAKWLWLLIFLVIVGALAFAVIRGIGPFSALNLGGSGDETKASPSTAPLFSSPSPTPEASEGANLDKSTLRVRVLNGSGTSGQASVVRDLLEGKGYNVVSVGNADTFDYERTTVKLKKDFSEFGDEIVKDLSDDYSVTVSTQALDPSSTADIEVIVGNK
ncbi:MAG: LytR C-terminal domain-containing protein [Candidatus Curtissbacteria bacterium]|nr:LytR C-terminal domain-containing protein [Candidatus Curtissbacteria bacterium]